METFTLYDKVCIAGAIQVIYFTISGLVGCVVYLVESVPSVSRSFKKLLGH